MSEKLLNELLSPKLTAELSPDDRAYVLQVLVDHIGADSVLRKRLADLVEPQLSTDSSGAST